MTANGTNIQCIQCNNNKNTMQNTDYINNQEVAPDTD